MKMHNVMIFVLLACLVVPYFPGAEAAQEYCAVFTVDGGGSISLRPHSSSSLNITIANNQNVTGNFSLGIDNGIKTSTRFADVLVHGLPVDPADGSRWTTGPMIAGGAKNFRLNITVPEGMDAGSSYKIVLDAATSQWQAFKNTTFEIVVAIPETPVVGVNSVNPATVYVDPGRPVSATVVLRNYGNTAGVFGVRAIGMPGDWNWTSTVVNVPSRATSDMVVEFTTHPGSSPGLKQFSLQVERDQSLVDDVARLPFNVVVNSVPYVAVVDVNYTIEAPFTRVFTGSKITVTVELENRGLVAANNISLVLRDAGVGGSSGSVLLTANVSLAPGASSKEEYVITFDRSGRHNLMVEVNSNSSNPVLLADFQQSMNIDVSLSPLLFILAGFLALTVFMAVVTLMLVYDRMRFSSAISMSSIKSNLDAEASGPDPGIMKDLDISSVRPEPLFTIPVDGRKKGTPETGTKGEQKKQGSEMKARKKGDRARLNPVSETYKEKMNKPAPSRAPPAGKAPAKSPPVIAPPARSVPPLGEEDNPEDEAALRSRLRDVETQINEAKLKDIDVNSLENMLREAKKAFGSREFVKTSSFIDTIERRVHDIMEKREEARKTIRDAQAMIYGLRYTDSDLSQPKSFLTKAETAYKNGDFAEAIKNAERGMNHATEAERMDGNGGSIQGGDDEDRL